MNKFTKIIKPARNQKETPIEALHLAEDLAAMDLAIKLIESVDEANIGATGTKKEREFNHDMKQTTVVLLKSWQHYAMLTMRRKYLAP